MLKCFIFTLGILLFGSTLAQDFTEEETAETVDLPNISISTNLKRIQTLDDHCDGSICQNFIFDSATEIAFFDLKTNIHIIDSSKYEVNEPLKYENLVFKNSIFLHFPLNLFYSLEINELDIRNSSIEIVTWDNFLMANKLQILLLSQNKLRAISESTFSQANELQYLFLDENQLHILVSGSFKGLKKLRYLNLSQNRLRELPGLIFSHLPELYELNMANNRLEYLPNEIFSRNVKLQSIVLNNNRLSQLNDYTFKNQPNMIFLDISNNNRLGLLILFINTQYLMATNCTLYQVNLFGDIKNADLSNNQIGELYFSRPETLEKLVLRNNDLQQIASLARATNLIELNIADNPKLEYLPDPWTVNSLERLDLSNVSLKLLPISNLAEQTNLRWLNVSNNKLKEINPRNFIYLNQLKHFYIEANDWNCYNLRLIMDLLIKPKNIAYKPDQYDDEFPGEYIEGIACMYRIEDPEVEDISSTSSSSSSESLPIFKVTNNSYETTNEYPTEGETEEQKLRNELKELRKELKAIVSFYETKFDVAFEKIENLNQRVAEFERMNATMFQHITIST